jgi:histidinol dehydrogenase
MREPRKLADLGRDEQEKILKRSGLKIEEVLDAVIPIVREVEKGRNEAVLKFTREFDGVDLTPREMLLDRKRIKEAYERVSSEVIKSLERMREQVEHFHRHQIRSKWEENKSFSGRGEGKYKIGERFIPLESAGVYVPGGKARYPSSAIMGIVPARVAGVRQVVVVSPPSLAETIADEVLVAADIAGADLIIRVGGAQAIAALAYGTENIPRVDIVVGAGNLYVTAAKTYLSSLGKVAIDCPAGPSEVLIIADESAKPLWVASDMLAQAEHDEAACSVLVTTSENLAWQVYKNLKDELPSCERRKVIERSLAEYGAILLVGSLAEAVDFANEFAPEHLELMVNRPGEILGEIRNTGSIFLGSFSPVAAGDYLTGTNHILPTGGSARGFSGLSVDSFLKRIAYQSLSPEALSSMRDDIVNLAKTEGPLGAHIRSINLRQE